MHRVFAIDVLLRDECGGRMKPIAEITERRVATKMLEHVGFPSDAPGPWPARGPPEWVESAPRFDGTWPDVEYSARTHREGCREGGVRLEITDRVGAGDQTLPVRVSAITIRRAQAPRGLGLGTSVTPNPAFNTGITFVEYVDKLCDAEPRYWTRSHPPADRYVSRSSAARTGCSTPRVF
jgi:hypothetical protein